MTNSAKYKDIISNSVQIHSGSPVVYQLRPKEETFGTLTRMTVGEKNPKKTNKTILLVGETGTGKSTLINALLNYSMGVKWEDNVWFQIVEEAKKSQTESQTSDVIVYEIYGFEDKTLPYSLTIIDTPGYGDTRGIEHDVIVSLRLLDLFRSRDGVHEVDALGLVMKASDNQLNDQLLYVFDSVMSLFGKDIEKNIVALITRSNGSRPKDALQALEAAKIKCAKNEKKQPVYFLFDNCQHEDRTEGEHNLQHVYQISETGMREFTTFLEKTEPQKVEKTVEVLNERIRLTACIQNLQDRIKLTELKQTEIKQIQEALKKHEEDMKKHEKFTVEVDEVYKDKQCTDGGMWWLVFYEAAVCCKVCEENCHYPGCTMAWKPEHCEVMKGGHCTVCTNKCPASVHVKEKWRYVIKTRKVMKTLEEMKKYDRIKSESDRKLSLLTAEKSQLLDESYQHVVRLEQITLKADSVSTHVHLDFLIEKMKEIGDTEKVQKLEEMRSRVDEGTRTALQYFWSKLTAFGKNIQEALKTVTSLAKYKDIISNSVLICPGSPVVYQLKTKKEKFGTLTRMTVGEKNPNKSNKTILLVGETGTGKSTLINTLLNYSMGVKWEDGVWFQITDEKKKSQTESQTSDVIVYEIFGFEGKTLPYSLTIIDTPGYGDTRGIKHDVSVSQRLFDLFRSDDGVHEVHAVGLVMQASVNRLSDRLLYVFDSVMSLFGKDTVKNIVALITHSNGRRPKDALQALEAAKIKCAKNEKNQPVYFLFDNCQHEDQTEDEEDLTNAETISKRGMREFTKFLEKTEPQKLEKTVEVLNERIRLTACIQNLQDRIKLTELKQTEIRQIQETLKKHEEKMKKHEKFTVEVDEVYKDKQCTDGGMWGLVFYEAAVCCTVCEENCHYPGCTMAWKPEHCEVMKGGHCTVCTNKCPASVHVKEKWRYVIKTRKVQKTMEDVKEKYDTNKSESENKLRLLKHLEKEMDHLSAKKYQLLDESYQHVANLEQIALKADSVSTYVHFDFLIEKMKETGDTEKVQKLEEMRSRMDEGTRTALQYFWSKLTAFGKNIPEAQKGRHSGSSASISSYPLHPLPSHQPSVCMNSNSTSNYIISKSDLNSSGPPAVYQLKPKKEKFGTLTRMTVGEKNSNKINKTILFVGETGAGKSTLINALLNYTMGVKKEDGVSFQIVDEKKKSQTESQTSDVIVYEIFDFEDKTLPYSLTIIDTPGYGNTRGIERDDIILQRLLDLFRSNDGVHEVDAVGLVMKASDNRLSDRLLYTFNTLMSLFGNDLVKNIVALITHSDGGKPKNPLQAIKEANIKCATNEENEPVYFLFNNCDTEDKTDKEEMTGMREFTDFLKESEPQKLVMTVDVLNDRIRLTACIQNLQEKIKMIELKQTEIKQIQEALKKHEEKMKKNEKFTVETDEVYKDKEPVDGGRWGLVFYQGAVCCTVCEETCHYPGCTMARKPKRCEVMKDGRCTVCTNKCLAADHVKKKWKYVTKTRKVKKTLGEMKEKFEKNKSEHENKLSLLENLEKEMNKLTAEKSRLLDESYLHVVSLQHIALKADSVSTIVHLDFLIEKMKETGDTEKVQKLKEMRSRVDEGTRIALRYKQETLEEQSSKELKQ